MEWPFAVSFLFLFISVLLIAQTSITVYNYNKNKQARDLNFYWSCFVLTVSIITALISMLSMFVHRTSAVSYVMAPAGAAPVAGVPGAPAGAAPMMVPMQVPA
jgi:hypothetical protein